MIADAHASQTGQYVQPGTVLATLVRRDPLLLRFKVPEADAAQLKPGMPARFTRAQRSAAAARREITHVAAGRRRRHRAWCR